MASVSVFSKKSQPDAGTVAWFNECVQRSKAGPFAEVVTITPGLASYVLSQNELNRQFRPVKSQHYAEDMMEGRWTFNGEPIIIADTGELNDGQHRMQALIDANICLPFLVTFGASRDSRKTVDQGAARCAADYLAMDGVKNPSVCAGMARLVMAYERQNGKNLSGAKDYTNAQILARVHADDKIHESAHFTATAQAYARGLLIPSIIGTAHYILSEINEIDARDYLNQVCIGENIKRGDPAFAVRAALASYERASKMPCLEIVMRGWNAYRQGRKLTLAKILGTLPALV